MLRRILIFLGYVFITTLLVGGTFALVAYGNDYSYDFATGKIIQKGHVIINSSPTGAKLTADGKDIKKKTPYQAAYKVGAHTFELVKDGFWPWKKTFEVVAGQVSLARYVVMVPKEPQSTLLDSRGTIVAQSISKDHRHLAYVTGGPEQALYTLDLGNPKPVKLYIPKAATETTPVEVMSDVSWSDDATHLLITSTMGADTVHRLAAASGGEPVNLTARYHYDFTGLKFSDSNWRQLYWIAPDGLRRLDVDTQSVSGVLADKVTQFWPVPDRVLYVQQTSLGRALWSVDSRGRHQELVQALVDSDAYTVAYTSYRGDDQLAVIPLKTQVGTLYSGIFGDTPVARTIARGVTGASFSPDGHLLVFTAPTSFVTYDLEQSAIYDRPVTHTVTDHPGQLLSMTWFDNYHLLANRDGKLIWSEYDGNNRIDLGPVSGALPAHRTADFKSLVEYRPEGTIVRLTQLQIKQ
jgi:hypothetical protein